MPSLGSLVFLRQHNLSKAADNFAAKLAPKYDGLYKFIKLISATIVRLQHLQGKQQRTASLAYLKEVASDTDILAPLHACKTWAM